MACAEGARGFLVVFNFIFWLSGATILGVGVWLSVDKDIQTFFDVIHIDTSDPYFTYSAYILVGFGAFVFLVGFLGCCGALRRHKGLIGLYIFFLVVVMAGELAAGILTAVYKNEIEVGLKGHLLESVSVKYGKHKTITQAMDYIQKGVHCCGVNGATDYEGSAWQNDTTDNVPISCCHLSSPPNKPAKAIDEGNCQANAYISGDSGLVYKSGCYNAILEWFRNHSAIVIGVGCGIAGLELFGLLFAVWMCCDTRKDEDFD